MTAQVAWAVLAGLAVAGALSVILARELTRLILGLGVFLVAVAGLYAYHGFGLLAVAQIFVYVGGVLVLFLFAITSMGRDEEGRAVGRRFDIGALSVSAGLAFLLVVALRAAAPGTPLAAKVTIEATATALLGPYLPQFEIVGVLLLAALAAGLAIVQGGDGE